MSAEQKSCCNQTAPKDHCCVSSEEAKGTCCNDKYGYVEVKEAYLRRLSRLAGQIRGIEKMIDEEKYCIDILTQISAATGALQSLALAMLDDHLSHCVVRAAKIGGEEAEIKLAEASNAIARLVKR